MIFSYWSRMYFLDEVVKTENIHKLETYDYLIYIYDQKSVSNEVKHMIEISWLMMASFLGWMKKSNMLEWFSWQPISVYNILIFGILLLFVQSNCCLNFYYLHNLYQYKWISLNKNPKIMPQKFFLVQMYLFKSIISAFPILI